MWKRYMWLTVLAASCMLMPVQASAFTYIAIGDSIAAGQTPDRKIGAGYADIIALNLQPDVYSKELAVPGYTTGQVIGQIQSERGQALIRKADLITVSAGANNLLPLIQNNVNSGILTFNTVTASFALNTVREEYASLLNEINQINPEADVYAMGYYFPYPYVFDQHKPAVARQLEILNQIVKQEAERAGAVFVPVADRFGLHAKSYLPNPKDVHPNELGYLTMANAFFNEFKPGTVIPETILRQFPEPVSLAELMKQREQAKKASDVSENSAEPQSTAVSAAKSCTKTEVYALAKS